MKTLIKHAVVFDGVHPQLQYGDVYLNEDRLEAVGGVIDAPADQVLDAGGQWMTPGFVDIHRHPDLAVFGDSFGQAELAQGITSVVGGNCGLSPVPMSAANEREHRAFLAPCLGETHRGRFEDFQAYRQSLSSVPLPLNMGMLAAVGAIMTCAKGYDNARFSPEEMKRARWLLQDALEKGALGVSLGIMYQPECFASQEEYVRLLSAATPYGRPLCCHIRGEGASLVQSVEEVLRLAQCVGLPLHISHFKSTGIRHWRGLIHQAIERIEKARAQGQDVTVDFYPYDAGASTLLSLVPPQLLGDQDAFLTSAATSEGKARMREAIYRENPQWDNMVQDIGWERILISSAEGMDSLAGLDFVSAAKALGVKDPADALCELLAATRGKAGVVLQSMCWDDVKTVAALPYSMLISDALYGGGAAHPRQKGAFPRFLKQFVPEVMSWEEALLKMTALPAKRLGLRGRGELRVGNAADLAVFSPQALTDRATYAHPEEIAQGMQWVFVNGQLAWENQTCTTRDAGRMLLAPKSAEERKVCRG